jgi:hypothetical protein
MEIEVKFKPMRDEKGVKENVKRLLNHFGYFWWMPPANGFGKVGVSDFHAIKAGVFIAIETKFGSNKPTVHQRAFLESIQSMDGFGFVVNDKTVEHLYWFLKDFNSEADRVAADQMISNEGGARMVDAMRALMALT